LVRIGLPRSFVDGDGGRFGELQHWRTWSQGASLVEGCRSRLEYLYVFVRQGVSASEHIDGCPGGLRRGVHHRHGWGVVDGSSAPNLDTDMLNDRGVRRRDTRVAPVARAELDRL